MAVILISSLIDSFFRMIRLFISRQLILRMVMSELQRIENKKVPQMNERAATNLPWGVTGYLSPYPTLGIEINIIQAAVGAKLKSNV